MHLKNWLPCLWKGTQSLQGWVCVSAAKNWLLKKELQFNGYRSSDLVCTYVSGNKSRWCYPRRLKDNYCSFVGMFGGHWGPPTLCVFVPFEYFKSVPFGSCCCKPCGVTSFQSNKGSPLSPAYPRSASVLPQYNSDLKCFKKPGTNSWGFTS